MTTRPSTYLPISCSFHDVLEALATTRKPVRIDFVDGNGRSQRRSAVITDVFSKEGAEYVSIATGETLRLDQLVEVDGRKLADH
jgi:Rho-binding antiterminator